MTVRAWQMDRIFNEGVSELLPKALLVVAVVTLGIAVGVVASGGDYKLIALVAAAAIGLIIAFLPGVLFWSTVVIAILVSGTARIYFPEFQGVRWLLPLGAWWLAGSALGYLLYARISALDDGARPTPVFFSWLLAFIAIMLISGLLEWTGAESYARGVKGYFQMWGLILALAFYPWSQKTIDRLPIFFLAAAWLQLPFVIHQYLVLVPARTGLGGGVVPVDIIAGTFGGQVEGGGDNAVLSLFLMIVLTGLLSAWRYGVMPFWKALLLGVPLVVPAALNVSKISIIYALVIFVMLFGSDIAKRPRRFAGAALLFAAMLAALATAYTAFAPKDLDTWGDLAEFTYQGNIAQDINNEGDLTRGGAVRYWFESLDERSLTRTLMGYGPGVTRPLEDDEASDVDSPLTAESKVGRLAVTAILWEGGVVAFVCILGVFVSAYLAARRLYTEAVDIAYRRALAHALLIAIVLVFISLWHKQFFVFHIGYQTVFGLILGYLAYSVRRADTPVKRPAA